MTMTGGVSFCPNCGTKTTGARFCPACGRPTGVAVTDSGDAAAIPERKRGWGVAELVLVLLIVAALVGGGLLILRGNVDRILADVAGAIPDASGTGRSSAATSRPTPRPTPRVTPTAPHPVPAGEYAAALGEAVPLVDTAGSELGDVIVHEARAYTEASEFLTADPGRMFVGARVEYVARAEFSYNPFDWVAHDDAGRQYEPSGFALDPELGAGTLARGRRTSGWVSFDVPQSNKALWIDYQTYDGEVIFSVRMR